MTLRLIAILSLITINLTAGDFRLIYKGDKVGLANDEGTILIPAKYEALGWSNGDTKPVNDVIGFKRKGLWGIINLADEVIAANSYSSLYPSGEFLIAARRGKVSKSEFVGLLSHKGKTLLPFTYSHVEPMEEVAIVSVRSGRKYEYGLVAFGGEPIIPIAFKDIKSMSKSLVEVVNDNGLKAVYDHNGTELIPFSLSDIYSLNDSVYVIQSFSKKGLIHSNGQLLKDIVFSDFNQDGDFIIGRPFNHWQIFEDKELVAKLKYDDISPLGVDQYLVKSNGYEWVVSLQDSVLSDVANKRYMNRDGMSFYQRKLKWGVSKDGKELLPLVYNELQYLNDRILARRGKEWLMFDEFGVQKNHQNYQEILKVSDRLFAVKNREKWGLIDRYGEEKWNCVFDELVSLNNDKAVVRFHKEFGIVNTDGDWVVTPQPYPIVYVQDDLYLIREPRLTKFMHITDGLIYFTENAIKTYDQYFLEMLADGSVWRVNYSGVIEDRNFGLSVDNDRSYAEGKLAVMIDDRYGFIDKQGRLVVANRYEDVNDFSQGLAAVKLLGKWGYIDTDERIVVQPNYLNAGLFENGLAIVQNQQGVGLIATSGNKVSSFNYDHIERMNNGFYKTTIGDKYGLLNNKGELLSHPRYDNLKPLANLQFLVEYDGKYGLIDEEGQDRLPTIYDEIRFDPHSGRYLALTKSDWQNLNELLN